MIAPEDLNHTPVHNVDQRMWTWLGGIAIGIALACALVWERNRLPDHRMVERTLPPQVSATTGWILMDRIGMHEKPEPWISSATIAQQWLTCLRSTYQDLNLIDVCVGDDALYLGIDRDGAPILKQMPEQGEPSLWRYFSDHSWERIEHLVVNEQDITQPTAQQIKESRQWLIRWIAARPFLSFDLKSIQPSESIELTQRTDGTYSALRVTLRSEHGVSGTLIMMNADGSIQSGYMCMASPSRRTSASQAEVAR